MPSTNNNRGSLWGIIVADPGRKQFCLHVFNEFLTLKINQSSKIEFSGALENIKSWWWFNCESFALDFALTVAPSLPMPNCRGQNSFFVQEFYFSCCSRTILIHLMVLKWIYHSFYSPQFSTPRPDACKYILTGERTQTVSSSIPGKVPMLDMSDCS